MEHATLAPRWLNTAGLQLPERNTQEKDELVHDLPFEQYLTNRKCISNSGLKLILESPRNYIAELLGMNKDEDEEKDHFRFGRAAHMMVLEPKRFRELHIVEPEFVGFTKDGRESKLSKEAKEKRAEWRANVPPDALVLTETEMELLLSMVDSLMSHQLAANMLRGGHTEVTGYFTDKETGIRVRIRPDLLTYDTEGGIVVADLKTTHNVSEGLFSDQMAKLRYNMQLALYVDGVSQILGKPVAAQAIIAAEKKMAGSTAVYWLTEEDLAKGRGWYKYALNVLKRCLDTNQWPGKQGDGVMINLPKWTEYEVFPQFDWRE